MSATEAAIIPVLQPRATTLFLAKAAALMAQEGGVYTDFSFFDFYQLVNNHLFQQCEKVALKLIKGNVIFLQNGVKYRAYRLWLLNKIPDPAPPPH